MPDLSIEDEAVIDKLQEAQALYQQYLEISAVAVYDYRTSSAAQPPPPGFTPLGYTLTP